jgi:hypothetical protein
MIQSLIPKHIGSPARIGVRKRKLERKNKVKKRKKNKWNTGKEIKRSIQTRQGKNHIRV